MICMEALVRERVCNLPARNRPHSLSRHRSAYWECHIEPDWLRIGTSG
ncbi:MAG: hypothetical protein F4126_02520 [Acidimicrobiaceae bacterium]|nr:hypothetical protein [Acidimicrobiaceae bacterium]MXZ53050.1 hypothetical protein [Acidimicrobiaceae bacterium]MYB86600.1 hypothetical protein [Acidimicrobiaceae bacterium]MYH92568.1 hypothetical protein [Acidimicrobiaceae bacterium]